jgi:signal transduction histidine kinase
MTRARPAGRKQHINWNLWTSVLKRQAEVRVAIFCALISLAAALPLHATELIRSVSYFVDDTRHLTLSDIEQQKFLPAGPSISKGFIKSIMWLRVTVAPAPNSEQVGLDIIPNIIDYITLYTPDSNGAWHSQQSGDLLLPAQRTTPTLLSHSFILPPINTTATYYIKIDTRTGTAIYISAKPWSEITSDRDLNIMINSLSVGMKLFSVALVYMFGIYLKKRIVIIFTMSQISFSIYIISRLGYLQAIFPNLSPNIIDTVTVLTLIFPVVCLILFMKFYTIKYAPRRFTISLSNFLLIITFLAIISLPTKFKQVGMFLTPLILTLVIPTAVLMLATLRRNSHKGVFTVRLIYGTLAGFLLLAILSSFGPIQSAALFRYSTDIQGTVGSALILFLIVALNRSANFREREEERRNVRQKLEVNATIYAHRFQENLIQIIAAQTRAVQSIISRAEAHLNAKNENTLYVSRAMARINIIIEHCQQAGRVEQGQWVTDPSEVDLRHIVQNRCSEIEGDRYIIEAPRALIIKSDRNLIDIALGHLISNANNYSKPGTSINIKMGLDQINGQAGAYFCIENTLDTHSDFDADRLFEKFYRGPGNRSKSGTGLGLFITQRIFTALGGSIRFDRETGNAKFNVWLPETRGIKNV